MGYQIISQGLINILGTVMHYSYPTLILLHGYNRSLLHTTTDIADKPVGNIDYLARTAVILGHFDKCTSGFLRQPVHIIRIGTSEFIDVLVIVSHCYHTHFFIVGHQSLYKCVFFCSHVLGFVYNQYCLTDFVRFYFFLTYHLGCL